MTGVAVKRAAAAQPFILCGMVMKRTQLNRFVILGFGALLAIGVALGLSFAAPNTEHNTTSSTAEANVATNVEAKIQPGSVEDDKPAPDFALADVNGKTIHLSDFKGKVVVLNFFATWCPPCRKELPDFLELQEQYGPKGLQFIGIALDEEGIAKAKPFAEAMKITYPTLLPNKSIIPYGEMNVIPVTFLIDKKGIVRTHYVGMKQKGVVEQMIQPLLAER